MMSECLRRGNQAFSPQTRQIISSAWRQVGALILCAVLSAACADEILMQNGDRYAGKIVSLTTDSLVLQSEMLGNINLPRAKVKLVTFGANDPTNSARPAPLTTTTSRLSASAGTNTPANLAAGLRSLKADTNLIEKVQADYLSAATPEANQKFNDLLNGLASGKMSLNDLRTEARTAADQLRAFKRDLGENAGSELDDYLDVLDRFLRETESPAATTPKPAGKPARP